MSVNLVTMSRPDSRYQIHSTQLVAELRCVVEPLLEELFEQVCGELTRHLGVDILKGVRAGESYGEALGRMDASPLANKLWIQGINNMCRWEDDLSQEIEQLRQKTDFRANIQRTLSSLAEACGRCAKWSSKWTPSEAEFLKRFVCCIADWPFFANIRYIDSNYDTRSQALRDVTERTCYRIMERATQDLPEDIEPNGALVVAQMIDNGHLRLSPVAEENTPVASRRDAHRTQCQGTEYAGFEPTGFEPDRSTTSRRSGTLLRSSNKTATASAVSNQSTRSTQSARSIRSERSSRRGAPSPQTRTIILSPDKSSSPRSVRVASVVDVASAISSLRSEQNVASAISSVRNDGAACYQSLAGVSLPVSPQILPEDSISNVMLEQEV